MSDESVSVEAPSRAPLLQWLTSLIKARIGTFAAEWVQPAPFDWRATLAIVLGTLVLFPLTVRLPMLGWDWYFFDNGDWYAIYPPWLSVTIAPLTAWDWRVGLALLNGVLLMTVATATLRETKRKDKRELGAALLALLTPPVFMMMWLGNVTILTLFGLVALPIGFPYAALQPHLTSWAILARRQWVLWGIGFFLLTLLIWGWWPAELVSSLSHRIQHPIAMGWQVLGWPLPIIGIVLLLLSNADPLRLMAAGAFLTPYMMPQHFLLLVPAIGRVEGRRQWLLWASVWLTLLPAMFLTLWSKYLAMLFPLLVWWLLRPRTSV